MQYDRWWFRGMQISHMKTLTEFRKPLNTKRLSFVFSLLIQGKHKLKWSVSWKTVILTICQRTSFTESNIINGNSFVLSLGLHHPPKYNLQRLTANQQEIAFTSVTDKRKNLPRYASLVHGVSIRNMNTQIIHLTILEDQHPGFFIYL